MTRGDEDIEGGLQKFLDSRKEGYEKIWGGGSKNLYTLKPTGAGGVPKKFEPLVSGAAKISSFEF